MLRRTALLAPSVGAVAGPSRVRYLSVLASSRPAPARPLSAVALGKRPAVLGSGVALSSRHLSLWSRWTDSAPSPELVTPAPTAPAPEASSPPSPEVVTPNPTAPAVDAPTPPEAAAAVNQATAADVPSPVSSPATTPGVQHAPAASDLADPASLSNPLAQMPPNATLGDMIRDSGLPIEDVLNSPEAVHAAASIADLKLAGLSHAWYSIPGWGSEIYLQAYRLTEGLPGGWLLAGALSALVVRTMLLRFTLRNLRHTSRMAIHGDEVRDVMNSALNAQKEGNVEGAKEGWLEYNRLTTKYGVAPFTAIFWSLIQAPFFFALYSGAQRIAFLPVPSLREGGLLWFTDLTLPDPYYILPTLAVAGINITMRLGPDGAGVPSSNEGMIHMQNAVAIASPILILLMGRLPTFVFAYWISTNIITIVTALIFSRPAVRRYLSVPPRPPASHDPTKKRPSIRASLKYAVGKYTDMHNGRMDRVAERRAQLAKKEKSRGRVDAMIEQINEAGYEGANRRRAVPELSAWDRR